MTPHKQHQTIKPMALMGNATQVGGFKTPAAPFGVSTQRPQPLQQPWTSTPPSQPNLIATIPKGSPQKPIMHDTIDELEDFFDPFPAKK